VRFEEGTFYLLYGERADRAGTYRYILEIALKISRNTGMKISTPKCKHFTALEYRRSARN
jgi:hypothetical protein